MTTNAEGIAIFDRFFAGAGVVVSATATDPNGNTSELFASMLVVNSVGDESDADPADGTADVDLATPGDQITLRSALEEAARRGVASIITFNIPVVDAEAPVIRPASALPAITQQTIVDARTQPETGFVILDGEESPFAGVLIDDGDEAFSVTLAGLEITRFGTGILNFATNSELTLARIVSTVNTSGLVSNGEVVIVEDSRFSHNLERGIRMESTANLTSLERSSLEASFNGMDGILLAAGGEGRLHNVTAVSNRSHGINTRFGPLRLTGENDLSFNHGNGIVAGTSFLEVEHLVASHNRGNGVFAGSISLLFGGNRIDLSSNNEDGFHRFGDDGLNSFNTPDDGEAESITIRNNRKFGIFQSPSQGAIILDNVQIENNLFGGISTSGTVFLGGTSNSISDNGGHGIEADRSVSIFGNTVIANNKGSGILSGGAVEIARADTVEISGNTSLGIDAEGRVDLDRVRIENNKEGGVRATGLVLVTGDDNVISGNFGDGLVSEADRVSVRNAKIEFSAGAGIRSSLDVFGRSIHVEGNFDLGIVAGGDIELFDSLVFGNQRPDVSFGGEVFLENSVIFATVVTNTNNDGYGSLRNAVQSVALPVLNFTPITFDMAALGPGSHTVYLKSDLFITQSVEILGPGANVIIVDGGQNTRLFSITEPAGDIDVEIRGLTLRGGNANDADGGAIFNDGASLTLREMVVTDNLAANGGAIYSLGDSDSSGGDEYGGYGGGGGTARLSIIDSVVSNNLATDGNGGGVWVSSESDIQQSTLSGNTARENGGGVYVASDFPDTSSGSAGSTFFGNRASFGDGGAVWTGKDFDATNSTFSGNTADGRGGGIHFDSEIEGGNLNHVTITENTAGTGGGLSADNAERVFMFSTILAGNNGGNVAGGISQFSETNLIGGERPCRCRTAEWCQPAIVHQYRRHVVQFRNRTGRTA